MERPALQTERTKWPGRLHASNKGAEARRAEQAGYANGELVEDGGS